MATQNKLEYLSISKDFSALLQIIIKAVLYYIVSLEKIRPTFWKVAKTVAKHESPNIYTEALFESLNIYIKSFLNS
jgi:hypothetical protein